MDKTYNEDSRQYLDMIQRNIERMAANSNNCKTWMIALVTAFIAFEGKVQNINGWFLLGIVPIILFAYLDSLYLSLERGMRNRERDFVNKVNGSKTSPEELKEALFNFQPLKSDKNNIGHGFVSTRWVWTSKSILGFYAVPIIIIILLFFIVK